MKNKSFIAINMNDFHANQNGNAETNTQMLFISAKNINDAIAYCKEFHRGVAWSVIPKAQIDKTIVYQEK